MRINPRYPGKVQIFIGQGTFNEIHQIGNSHTLMLTYDQFLVALNMVLQICRDQDNIVNIPFLEVLELLKEIVLEVRLNLESSEPNSGAAIIPIKLTANDLIVNCGQYCYVLVPIELLIETIIRLLTEQPVLKVRDYVPLFIESIQKNLSALGH